MQSAFADGDTNHAQQPQNDLLTTEFDTTLKQQLEAIGYIADDSLAASLALMDILEKPLLIEGEAGVGKTDIARSLAAIHQAELIRLQCYEGLDARHALYDWDYRRQLLAIQMASRQHLSTRSGDDERSIEHEIYSEHYLSKRPLLAAITSTRPVVLLIDEIDRADEEFEALLLELLSDFQITIPELGTFSATRRPRVILTSNGIRELSDALRRRCLYHYLDYPSAGKELAIVRARLPKINSRLARQLVDHVQKLRQMSLRKTPGVAETLDWAAALLGLGLQDLTDNLDALESTLSCLIKTREDQEYLNRLSSENPPADD